MNQNPRSFLTPERIVATVTVLGLAGFILQRLGAGLESPAVSAFGAWLIRPLIIWGALMAIAFIGVVAWRALSEKVNRKTHGQKIELAHEDSE